MKNFKNLFSVLLLSVLGLAGMTAQKTELHSLSRTAQILVEAAESQTDTRDYSNLTDNEFYSVSMHMDSTLQIVYKPSDYRLNVIENISKIGRKQTAFDQAGDIVEAVISSFNKVEYTREEDNPFILLRTEDYSLISQLRQHPNVEYIGFAGFSANPQVPADSDINRRSLKSDSERQVYDMLTERSGNSRSGRNIFTNSIGCVNEAATEVNVACGSDGTSIPWHYIEQGVPCANAKSAGKGIKVALLDVGLSPDQPRLGTTGFKKSYSGRSITKKGTYGTIWPKNPADGHNTKCGHGTHMAGVIAGPVYDEAVRGVAYECDLLSVECTGDVVLNLTSELASVYQALRNIRKGTKSGYGGVKIVSMSIGMPFIYDIFIAGELTRLKDSNVLVFAAASTSPETYLPGTKKVIIFPAYLNSTIAVTGVYSGFPNIKTPCDRCHYGDNVDFVVPMQLGNLPGGKDAALDIVTHSLTMDDDKPSSVGGSSIATATMAGMAAVIWGAPENINKDATDILNMMIENSTYPYSKDTEYGHGVIDLLQILDVNCEPLEYPCDTDEEDPCATKVCPKGQNCVNGNCIPDVINCGDVPCPVGYDCVNGICIPQDGNGIECINGMCPQDMKCVNGVCVF